MPRLVLVSKDSKNTWSGTILSSTHNGLDQAEVTRVRDEHPGEEGAVIGFRVLGAIMVTRGTSGCIRYHQDRIECADASNP
jgi:hypothetical protein